MPHATHEGGALLEGDQRWGGEGEGGWVEVNSEGGLSVPHAASEGGEVWGGDQRPSEGVGERGGAEGGMEWGWTAPQHTGEEEELVIYMKAGFVVEGLLEILGCCGATVLLRDVELQQTNGE